MFTLKNNSAQLYLFFAVFFCGCISGGTHGSIRCYEYSISKNNLERAVTRILATNPKIVKDSVQDRYNDTKTYISFKVNTNNTFYTYTTRYGGDTIYWYTSKVSSIYIAYAHDENANGGSAGDGGMAWYKFRLRRKVISPFEKEFIDKIDKELGIKHTVAK